MTAGVVVLACLSPASFFKDNKMANEQNQQDEHESERQEFRKLAEEAEREDIRRRLNKPGYLLPKVALVWQALQKSPELGKKIYDSICNVPAGAVMMAKSKVKKVFRRKKFTKLDKFKQVCREQHIVIKDDEYIDVFFAVIKANELNSIPLFMRFVGPPSSGKTLVIDSPVREPAVFYDDYPLYGLDTLTAASLITGKKGEPSLLQDLNGKVWLMKDETALLTDDWRVAKKIYGLLRVAYDGAASKAFGTTGPKGFKSKFSIISASTNIIDRHAPIIGSCGERFLNYRLPLPSQKEEDKRTDEAIKYGTKKRKERTAALHIAASEVVLQKAVEPRLPDNLVKDIRELAKLGAVLRTPVLRDRQGFLAVKPDREIAPRLGEQLTTLAKGHAMVNERNVVKQADLKSGKTIVVSGINSMRYWILEAIYKLEQQGKIATVSAAEKVTRISRRQVAFLFDELYLLNVVTKKAQHIRGEYDPYKTTYRLRRKYKELLKVGCHIQRDRTSRSPKDV